MSTIKLELAIINSMMDDYESIDTVHDEIVSFLGKPISVELLFTTFLELVSQRFIKAYRLGSDSHMKPTASPEIEGPDRTWFLITEKGRAFIDSEWNKYFQ